MRAALLVPLFAGCAPEIFTTTVEMRDGIRLATDVYLPPGDGPFPVVEAGSRLEEVAGLLADRNNAAVLVRSTDGTHGIVTKHDLISHMAR